MERYETVIIGGGQAGLATGRFLKQQGRQFVILDAHQRVGDSWRMRWDSLRVFTPARYSELPGMQFPAPRLSFPTKDQVADYMAAYAAKFELPVRNGVRVDGLKREGDGFLVSSNAGTFEADNVVVATGPYQVPNVPDFGSQLGSEITQLHSSSYRNPAQLRDGAVLVVGVGNSGAEIAYDVRGTHKVLIAGKPFGQMPFPHGPVLGALVIPLLRWVPMYVITMDTPIGRKALPKMKTAPLVRLKLKDLEAAGIERVPRVMGVRDGLPLLADGRTVDVTNVIWCTGFHTDFSWIGIPAAFGPDRNLVQHRGAASHVPGLYFISVGHLYSAVSDVLPGVGRDAAYVAHHIANRMRSDGRVDSKDRVVGRDPAEVGVR